MNGLNLTKLNNPSLQLQSLQYRFDKQRAFLLEFAKKNNINNPKDWASIRNAQIKKAGGTTLLRKYNNSSLRMLRAAFPELSFEDNWFRRKPPVGFWDNKNNQRNFLIDFAKEHNIVYPRDWAKITSQQIQKKGGSIVLKKNDNNIMKMLKNLFPEQEIDSRWFSKKHPKSYWESETHQQQFLSELGVKYNIRKASDWLNITTKHIKESGGANLLRMYGGSPKRVILSILNSKIPELQIDSRSSKDFWNVPENQRKFLSDAAIQFGVKKPEDWKNVSLRQIEETGGTSLLKKYGNSPKKMLESVFPEIKFEESWFVSKRHVGYWKQSDVHIQFLEDFAKRYNIKKPKDWSGVTAKQIMNEGGYSILQHYGNSPMKMLKSVFPTIEWKSEWFNRVARYRESYWNSFSNCTEFLNSIAASQKVTEMHEWKRITLSTITKMGGAGLLKRYNYSMFEMLNSLFPSQEWQIYLASNSSSPQGLMEVITKGLFPAMAILSNNRKRLPYQLEE